MSYSFTNFIVAVNGVQIQGFINTSDALTWEWNTPLNSMQVGADGKPSTFTQVDHSAKVMMKLQWESPSNQFLGGLIKAQQSVNKTVESTINITNSISGMTLVGSYSVIGTRASGALGNTFTQRDYEFLVANMVETPGTGYTQPDASILEQITQAYNAAGSVLGAVNSLSGIASKILG